MLIEDAINRIQIKKPHGLSEELKERFDDLFQTAVGNSNPEFLSAIYETVTWRLALGTEDKVIVLKCYRGENGKEEWEVEQVIPNQHPTMKTGFGRDIKISFNAWSMDIYGYDASGVKCWSSYRRVTIDQKKQHWRCTGFV